MPKLKTHSGAKKRFNLTKSGKVKRAHAFKSHILTKKDTKRGRRLRSGTSAWYRLSGCGGWRRNTPPWSGRSAAWRKPASPAPRR